MRLLEFYPPSLATVIKAAAVLIAGSTQLDILMLRPGIIVAPLALTADSDEKQFGINY
jgi:hypothetical protein